MDFFAAVCLATTLYTKHCHPSLTGRETPHSWWFILLMKGPYTALVLGKLLLEWKALCSCQELKTVAVSLWRDSHYRHRFQSFCTLLTVTETFSRRARCTQRSCNRELGANICVRRSKTEKYSEHQPNFRDRETNIELAKYDPTST